MAIILECLPECIGPFRIHIPIRAKLSCRTLLVRTRYERFYNMIRNIGEASKVIEVKTSPKTLRERISTKSGENLEIGRKHRVPFDAPGESQQC